MRSVSISLLLLTCAACAGKPASDSADVSSDGATDTSNPEATGESTPVPDTGFERQPYVALVHSVPGDQDLLLIGAHSKPEAAVQEANWLDDVYVYALSRDGQTNGLILGDLNLACEYASSADLAGLDLRTDPRFRWLVSDTMDTSVANESCAFDRIVAAGDGLAAAPDATVSAVDIQHSDHRPLSVEVMGIRVGTFNAQRLGESKVADPAAVAEIAGIICSNDVTLIEEIVESDTAPTDALMAEVKSECGDDMTINLSDPTGSTSYKERFAYIYKPSRVTVTSAYLFPGAEATPADQAAQQSAPAPAPAPSPSPTASTTNDCGVDPYTTPKGYCYATKGGAKKRVAGSCCQ